MRGAFLRRAGERPVAAALIGACAIAFSGIIYVKADVSPETGAFFRCLYALPPLWLLVWFEDRALGKRDRRQRAFAWVAGVFLAVDLLFWHHAIEAVGAGLATVLANTQVVLVGLAAWALLGERPARSALAAIPLAGLGVVLISGVLEEGAYGDDPLLGAVLGLLAGVCYTGFLLALRHGSRDLRRLAGPLYDATLAAAVVLLVLGLLQGDLDLTPPGSAHAWLLFLALTNQVGCVALDHDVAASPAGGADIDPADAAAGGVCVLRRPAPLRAALGAAARRHCGDPRGARRRIYLPRQSRSRHTRVTFGVGPRS